MAKVDFGEITGNSYKEAAKKKEASPIVIDQSSIKKRSALSKATSNFFADDFNSVKDYIIEEWIIPGIKNIILGSMERLLFGSTSRSVTNGSKKSSSYGTSYHSYYRSKDKGNSASPKRRSKFREYEDFVFTDVRTAEQVLGDMMTAIEQYDSVGVDDLYTALGMVGEFTDCNYGWKNLSKASVKRVAGGFILDLPDPVVLD